METPSYAHHRFPPAIIQRAVWLYFQFALSYRDFESISAQSVPRSLGPKTVGSQSVEPSA